MYIFVYSIVLYLSNNEKYMYIYTNIYRILISYSLFIPVPVMYIYMLTIYIL